MVIEGGDMNVVRRLPILLGYAWLAASACAASDPVAAIEARDIQTIQALNPLPHCLSSWPAMKDWLSQGFTRAQERAAYPANWSGDSRWIRLDTAGQRVNAKNAEAPVACIQDAVTQLVWAVGLEGRAAIGRFPGGPADISTESLIGQARAKQWCGKSDWKLPSKTQALSLVSFAHVRIDSDGSAWRQSGFPVAGSVWSDSRSVRSSGSAYQWTVSLSDGYTYLQSPVFQPNNDTQRHTALLVTSGSCTWLHRAFAK